MLRVAVIGSGPSGIYAAGALTSRGGDVTVDVLDRLPCPYGLVRYGVAPDHLRIKSIAASLQKILEDPAVRFLGNVEFGRDVTLAELHHHYDAVVMASGAAVDRRLGVPGEDLAGSFSATEFVSWYSGHPDAAVDRFTLGAHTVAVIGVGNVAIDVARILAKTTAELRSTDLPDHVLDVLDRSTVADIHMIGRRGPVQAKFTTKELRELGELADADVIVDPAELAVDAAGEAALAGSPQLRHNLEVLRAWSERTPVGRSRRLHVRFLHRPVAVLGDTTVQGLRLERTALDGSGGVTPTGETTDLTTQLILRSVGYRGVALPDLPFDDATGCIPSDAGRILRDGAAVPGEYVTGWIRRGPTGVIGSNKRDASETVASLLADAPGLPPAPERDPDALVELLAARGVNVVPWAGWQAIEAAELGLGAGQGRDRVKIHDWAVLLSHAGLDAAATAPRGTDGDGVNGDGDGVDGNAEGDEVFSGARGDVP